LTSDLPFLMVYRTHVMHLGLGSDSNRRTRNSEMMMMTGWEEWTEGVETDGKESGSVAVFEISERLPDKLSFQINLKLEHPGKEKFIKEVSLNDLKKAQSW